MTKWLLFCSAITVEVAGTLLLKGSIGHPAYYAVVAGCYCASFVLLGRVLQLGLPLGLAYGIWGACGVAATAILSAIIFNESISHTTAAGLSLVALGVVVVQLGSQAATEGRHGNR